MKSAKFGNEQVTKALLLTTLIVLFGVSIPAMAEEEAYNVEFAYTLDVIRVSQGGIEKGNAVLDNVDLMFTIDTEKAWGLPNGTAFLYFLSNNGDDVNENNVGSVQGVDNIEADDVIKVYEAWYEYAFPSSTMRVGLYDLNSEFDSIETAGLFINPSHGIGPDYSQSGRNGPSIFPTTSFSIRYASEIGDRGYWKVAVLDGVPGDPDHLHGTHIHFKSGDGALIAVEGGARNTEGNSINHWAVGGWRYTDHVTEDAAGDAISSTQNHGLYAFFDKAIDKNVSAYLRLGVADAKINQIVSYVGAGVVWSGMGGRDDDQAGIAVAVANNSQHYIDATGSEDREIIWELTYRSQIFDWLVVQPDVQYVQNPGTDPQIDDALVLGIRFEVSY